MLLNSSLKQTISYSSYYDCTAANFVQVIHSVILKHINVPVYAFHNVNRLDAELIKGKKYRKKRWKNQSLDKI